MTADTVVLLHGLGRSPWAMNGLAGYLRRQEFTVLNQGYASRQGSIAGLCQQILNDLKPHFSGLGKIHFVTHSLGGILLRYGLQSWDLPVARLGRAVMLAPPTRNRSFHHVVANSTNYLN